MIDHCDQYCENYTFLKTTPALKYERRDETWILLKGSGRTAGYAVPFTNTMGLLNFNQPVLEDREVQGTYVYPDWVTCVTGTWKNYILQRGRYCKITKVSNKVGLKLAIKTEEMNSSPELRYLPPSYNGYGPPPTQTDPFEMNTVEVRGTDMRDMDTSADQGEGLFVTRDIKRGELVCFYSGRLVNSNHMHLLDRRNNAKTMVEKMYQKKFSLNVNNKIMRGVIIDIPPKDGKMKAYRTTVGHKANHSFRHNAEYHPFQFHPVLGFIEAVVAVKDITKGSEVFCNYGYGPDTYNATGIFPQDLECSLGSCLEVTSMTKNVTLKKPNTSNKWLREEKMKPHLI